ncbi:MAG: hypothetical protein ACFCUR_11465 [Rhodomicrobiaceae bacterium]
MAARADEKSSVCVFSRLGEQFHMKKIGIMVFGNEYSARPIPEWKIDEKVRAIVEKALSSQFDVKQIAVPAELGEAVDKLRGGLLSDGKEENAPILSRLGDKKECKYFLLIASAGSSFGSTNQAVGGLGVVEAESLFGDIRYVHAIAQARIFDGRSYAFLDWKNLRTGQNIFTDAIQGPHQKIDFEAHASLEAVADDPKTQEILLALLQESVQQTLPAMLAVDRPEAVTSSVNQQQSKKNDDWAPF